MDYTDRVCNLKPQLKTTTQTQHTYIYLLTSNQYNVTSALKHLSFFTRFVRPLECVLRLCLFETVSLYVCECIFMCFFFFCVHQDLWFGVTVSQYQMNDDISLRINSKAITTTTTIVIITNCIYCCLKRCATRIDRNPSKRKSHRFHISECQGNYHFSRAHDSRKKIDGNTQNKLRKRKKKYLYSF